MPGYLVQAGSNASSISFVPSGNVTANNLQEAIAQLDTNKAQQSALSASVTALNTSISSVEGVALIGL